MTSSIATPGLSGELPTINEVVDLFPAPEIPEDEIFRLKFMGHLVSNDLGFADIRHELHEALSKQTGGVAVFLGAGGCLSLLPEIQSDLAIRIDFSPGVIGFNRSLDQKVLEAESPEEVTAWLGRFHRELPVLSGYAAALMRVYGVPTHHLVALPSDLQVEAENYGDFHWTNPGRFELVQKALGRVPIANVCTDMTDVRTTYALQTLDQEYGMKVSFANLSNLHQWFPEGVNPEFVRDWPLSEDAVLLYAGGWVPDYKMHITRSVDDYLAFTAQDPRDHPGP